MNKSTKTKQIQALKPQCNKNLHLSVFKQASSNLKALLGPFLHGKDHPPEEPWLEVQLQDVIKVLLDSRLGPTLSCLVAETS